MTIAISSIAGITEKHLAGQHDQKLHGTKRKASAKRATPDQIRRNKAKVKVLRALMAAGTTALTIGGLYALNKIPDSDRQITDAMKREIINAELSLQNLKRDNEEKRSQILSQQKKLDENYKGGTLSYDEWIRLSKELRRIGLPEGYRQSFGETTPPGTEPTEPRPPEPIVPKHLPGLHNQKRHTTHPTHSVEHAEKPEFMSAAEVRQKLGIKPNDRNSLSRFVGHARVGRDTYNREVAQAAIDKILEQRMAKEDAHEISLVGISSGAIGNKLRQTGMTPEELIKHESHLSQAARDLKEAIKRSLSKPEISEKISKIQRDFLTALYGVDRPKETIYDLAKRAEDDSGEPYSPAWVFKQISVAEDKLGIDVDKIAFDHGVQRRELIRYINRASTKGKHEKTLR